MNLNMDRNHWKSMLPIIQSYAEGKEIEYFDTYSKKWKSPIGPLMFSLAPERYRIKQDPCKLYLLTSIQSDGQLSYHYSYREYSKAEDDFKRLKESRNHANCRITLKEIIIET